MLYCIPEQYDSRYRFILVAAERAKQIQRGAPPRVKTNSVKPARIAIEEVEKDLIEYDVLEEDFGQEQVAPASEEASFSISKDEAVSAGLQIDFVKNREEKKEVRT